RDDVVYDFQSAALEKRVKQFIEDYNAEVDRYKRLDRPENVDDFVHYERVKWSESLKSNLARGSYGDFSESNVRDSLYRPFCKESLYFDRLFIERVYVFPSIFPTAASERENRMICMTDLGSEKPFMTFFAGTLPDLHLVGAGSSTQCFPFYVYEEDGSHRRENITDWALEEFRKRTGDANISKWDIFYYVYGLLHHPGYREKFADNLKRELPRIPLAGCAAPAGSGGSLPAEATHQVTFRAFADAGKKLAELHVNYEKLEPWALEFVETPGKPLSYRVEDKMRLNKDKTSLKVNPSLTLAGIPPETCKYRLGNRSALEWVVDQYQVSEDKKTGARSDPNRPDDPEYIVRLVGQVVRVSLETVKIVEGLPGSIEG
ncbi:MAG: type ISP restriction/modification enzyme, partial [bacterium]